MTRHTIFLLNRLRKKTPLFWLLLFITVSGDTLVLNSLRLLSGMSIYESFLIVELMVIGLIVTPWSVKMPSGATWRPGVPLMMVSVFLLPPALAILVNIPALIFITARARRPWWKYCETIAHAALRLYLSGITYLTVQERLQGHYFTQILAVLMALLVHLIVNRLVSVVIVAHREGRSLWRQILFMWKELYWGYFSAYLVIFMTSMVSTNYAPIAVLIAALILFFIFSAVSNYSRLRVLQTSVQTDGLTSLENRTAWEALLQENHNREIASGIKLYMIDINNFKDINDRYGHLIGDKTLRRVAEVLKNAAPSQARIFRIGGDEFVIYLVSSVSAHSQDLETRMREQVVKEFEAYDGLEEVINLSIGSACAPEDGRFLIDLVEVSDHRMYEDKRYTRFRQSGHEWDFRKFFESGAHD